MRISAHVNTPSPRLCGTPLSCLLFFCDKSRSGLDRLVEGAVDDLQLLFFGETVEVDRIARDTDGEHRVEFGMLVGFNQHFTAQDIDIEVHGVSPDVLKGVLDSLGQRMEIGESFGIFSLKGYSLEMVFS